LSIYHLLTEELDFAENHVAQMVLAVVAGASLLAYLWRLVQMWRQEK